MHMTMARGRLLPALAMLALHAAFLLVWLAAQRPAAPAGAAAFILATMVPAPRPAATPKAVVRPRAQQLAQPIPPQTHAPLAAAVVQDAKPEADPLAEAAPSGLLEQARRAAGRADLALRDGKPLPPLVRGDTPFARFERAVEGAYVGGARNGILEDTSRPKGVSCPPGNAGWTRL